MVIGLTIMTLYFNMVAGLLSLVSLLLYTFIYTPLKRVGPIAVFIGAIPGALPPLIGWVAFSGEISIEAIIISVSSLSGSFLIFGQSLGFIMMITKR